MKNILISLTIYTVALLFSACNKDNHFSHMTQEEFLIEKIVNAPMVEAVSVQNLIPSISKYVNTNHPPLTIELVFYAAPHGYEIFLENGLCLFFDTNGNHLDHDGMHDDFGNHHGGMDPGINFCLAGDTLDIDDMPQIMHHYIDANYPGTTCMTFVLKSSGNMGVEISTGDILMFGPNGAYHHFCEMQAEGGHGHWHGNIGSPGWHCDVNSGTTYGGHNGSMGHGNHGGMNNQSGQNQTCWGGASIDIDELPPFIENYIDTNHPEATIVHIMQSFNQNYFVRLSDCSRIVFDENGDILFDSGK